MRLATLQQDLLGPPSLLTTFTVGSAVFRRFMDDMDEQNQRHVLCRPDGSCSPKSPFWFIVGEDVEVDSEA